MTKKDEILAASIILILIIIVVTLLLAPGIHKYKNHVISSPNQVETLLKSVNQTFQIPFYGIIHIGARHAEELEIYNHLQIKDILWIEADPSAEAKLREAIAKSPNSKLAFFAATDKNGTIDLYRTTNDGHSSSILKLKNHLFMAPTVLEEQIMTVRQRRLDDYLSESNDLKNIRYNRKRPAAHTF